jgi:14-3-3 protein epsilon
MNSDLFMAKIAEQAERYEDMFQFLIPLFKTKDHYTTDQRNLFSVAFKNLITPKRTTLRKLRSYEQYKSYSDTAAEAMDKYTAVVECRL